MRAAWLVIALVACKGKDGEPHAQPSPGSGSGPGTGIVVTNPHAGIDAAPAPVVAPTDWAVCEKALKEAPKKPAMRRVQGLIEACKPCGEWTPLLEWNKEQVDGGPKRLEIEQAMIACKGYCDPNAKQRFLGTLDNARGKGSRAPWRYLGEMCKAKVSAVPDARYMSAPYFALDRIARAAGERPELAPLLDAIEIPLPPVTITGSGFELPKSSVTAPDPGALALTVNATELRIATAPRAKLSKDGVQLVVKGEWYPGAVVKTQKDFDAQVATLGPGMIGMVAPFGMPASHLVKAVQLATAKKLVARLVVTADHGLPGWDVTGTIPIALVDTAGASVRLRLDDDADATIKKMLEQKAKVASAPPAAPPIGIDLGPKATVGGLAKLLGAIAYLDIKTVAIALAK